MKRNAASCVMVQTAEAVMAVTKRVWSVLSVVGVASTLWMASCGDDDPPAEGEGDAAEGEGDSGEGEGDVGEGEGEGEDRVCNPACGDGQVCGSLYGGDLFPTACFSTCDDGNAPCVLAIGGQGECSDIDDFSDFVCRVDAASLGSCGNALNAGCTGDLFCVPFDDDTWFPNNTPICVDGCTAATDCEAGLACSEDLAFTDVPGGSPRGVCAPPSSIGAACGRLADGTLVLCTDGQRCDAALGAATGTCQ
jgi:hypothetical protein